MSESASLTTLVCTNSLVCVIFIFFLPIRDITNMKGGTIVAQVDSSESFQEFCSTGCLAAYENKQNPQKNQLKTKCTVCGTLTEVRQFTFCYIFYFVWISHTAIITSWKPHDYVCKLFSLICQTFAWHRYILYNKYCWACLGRLQCRIPGLCACIFV